MEKSESIVPYSGVKSLYRRVAKPVGVVLASVGLFASGAYAGMEYEKAKIPSVEMMRVEQEASVEWNGRDFVVEERSLKRQRVRPSDLELRVEEEEPRSVMPDVI